VTRRSVVIIGGGISGLCAAYELSGGAAGPSADTPRIEVIEAAERWGGSLTTTSFAGRTIDLGADGFLGRRPEAVALAHDLGLGDELEPIAASGASIYLNGALDPLPAGMVLGVPTSTASLKVMAHLPARGRREAWRDAHFPRRWRAGEDATIGEILRRKFGPTLTYQLIEPMIGGIQAGRVDDLSAKSVFPALLTAAQKKGSLMKNISGAPAAMPGPTALAAAAGPAFYSLRHGVGSLVSTLTATLAERGVVLRSGTAVTMLRRTPTSIYPWEIDTAFTSTPAHAVICATPVAVTGALAGAFHSDLAALVAVPSAGAAMVTLQLSSSITLPAGTGILVPLQTPFGGDTLMTTAVTFLDRKWAHLQRDEDQVVRIHVGRSDDSRWQHMTDVELTSRVVAELSEILREVITPIDSLVQRWPNGLPQYRVGHDEIVQRALVAAEESGLALCGNAFDGVGVPATIANGRRVGHSVLERVAN